jgi:hypothetical protein
MYGIESKQTVLPSTIHVATKTLVQDGTVRRWHNTDIEKTVCTLYMAGRYIRALWRKTNLEIIAIEKATRPTVYV